VEPITIIADSREQLPYAFESRWAVTIRRALPAGDYSVEGWETSVAVERKTLEDFVHSVIRDRKRFKKELAKLSEYPHSCVVVEASLTDVLLVRYPSGAHPNSVFGAVVSIIIDHGIPVYFCGDRQAARKFTQEYLMRAVRLMKDRSDYQEKTPDSP